MEAAQRVCPFCGEPPGAGVFCDACGRSLADVQRLPTRAQWEAGAPAADSSERDTDNRPPAERCAEATQAFLAAMEAAGRPGAEELPTPRESMLRRAPRVHGWIVRPVQRDDDVKPRRYTPGLLLSVDGAYHRLDNELRGFGQRDFPRYEHTVAPEPLPEPPADTRLPGELRALLAAHGL